MLWLSLRYNGSTSEIEISMTRPTGYGDGYGLYAVRAGTKPTMPASSHHSSGRSCRTWPWRISIRGSVPCSRRRSLGFRQLTRRGEKEDRVRDRLRGPVRLVVVRNVPHFGTEAQAARRPAPPFADDAHGENRRTRIRPAEGLGDPHADRLAGAHTFPSRRLCRMASSRSSHSETRILSQSV